MQMETFRRHPLYNGDELEITFKVAARWPRGMNRFFTRML